MRKIRNPLRHLKRFSVCQSCKSLSVRRVFVTSDESKSLYLMVPIANIGQRLSIRTRNYSHIMGTHQDVIREEVDEDGAFKSGKYSTLGF